MNCQRALWYNSEGSVKPGVLVLRMQDLDRRNAVNAAKEAAAANRSARAVTKAAQATAAIEAVTVEPRKNHNFIGFCSNECSMIARTTKADSVDDKWRGCTTCDKMFCSKLNCAKKLKTHQKHCLAISVMHRGAFV